MVGKMDDRMNREEKANTQAAASPDTEGQLSLGFTGQYTHGLDAKGRIIMPVAFRPALGNRFAVCPSPDFKDIAVYPLRAWVDRRDEYLALCKKNAMMRRVLDQFTKYSYVDSEMDVQGRLLLPAALRTKLLGDTKEVDINGSYDHIIVQDSKCGEDADLKFAEDFPDVYAFVSSVQKE